MSLILAKDWYTQTLSAGASFAGIQDPMTAPFDPGYMGPLLKSGATPFKPSDLGAKFGDELNADIPGSIALNVANVITWTGVAGILQLTQATDALRPVYEPTGWNGNAPQVRGNGSQYLEQVGVPVPLQGAGNAEFWALVDQQTAFAAAGTTSLFALGNVSATTRTLNRIKGATTNQMRAAQGNNTASFSSDAPSDYSGHHVVRGIFTAADVTAEQDTVDGPTTAVACVMQTTRLRLFAFSAAAASQIFTGSIRGLTVCIDTLTPAEAAKMYTYYNAKL